MKDAPQRSHWTWAAIGGVIAVGAVLALFRSPRPPPAPRPEKPPRDVAVRLDSNPALREQSELFDPKPLFLPVNHITATPKEVEPREPGAAFPNYEPKLGFAEAGLKLEALALPKPVTAPPSPATAPGAVLALPSPGTLALGFGRTDAPVAPLPARSGFVEVYSATNGRQLLGRPLAEAARPPGNAVWQPLEFVAAVDPAGLVGPLMPVQRSGAEEVDSFFQNYLARTLRLGELLPPGFYRIRVGP